MIFSVKALTYEVFFCRNGICFTTTFPLVLKGYVFLYSYIQLKNIEHMSPTWNKEKCDFLSMTRQPQSAKIDISSGFTFLTDEQRRKRQGAWSYDRL